VRDFLIPLRAPIAAVFLGHEQPDIGCNGLWQQSKKQKGQWFEHGVRGSY